MVSDMADSLKQPLLNAEGQNGNGLGSVGAGGGGGSEKLVAGGNFHRFVSRVVNFFSWIIGLIRRYLKRIYDEATKSAQPAKAGLAAALCSVLCFAPPPFDMFNKNGVWAVVTADVVLEANVGLTISKGLNRTLGTLAAAVLALGVNYYAVNLGAYEPFYIMGWVFFGAALATMFKFRRPFKDRWNYAVAISMITFHILILSKSEHKDKIVLPLIRLATIVIGFLTMSLVNLGIAPKYAGSGISELIAKNFERAGTAMERCVTFYLEGKVLDQVGDILTGRKQDDSVHTTFTEMVAADAECDKLLKAVPFEPCHGRFFYQYPWHLYTDVTDNLRYTLYDVIALDSCLRAEIQAPGELRKICKDEFEGIGKECAEVFRLLGESIRNMKLVDCGYQLKTAEEWVKYLKHKIAKHSQTILVGAKDQTGAGDPVGYGGPEFEDVIAISYSDSVFNTPGLNTPALTPAHSLICRSVTPTHSFVHGRGVDGTQGLSDERRKELKRNIKTRISALSLIKFASLLIELVAKAKYMDELVRQLADRAQFVGSTPSPSTTSAPVGGNHHV
ncbi:hypothetical protein R1flu_023710 [Riccia fluitans]|uniref:Uncharacterized protein n=1 Tax=Riccia fluitans TaxID=41844 RepID=A0ABD1XTM3_9MARC